MSLWSFGALHTWWLRGLSRQVENRAVLGLGVRVTGVRSGCTKSSEHPSIKFGEVTLLSPLRLISIVFLKHCLFAVSKHSRDIVSGLLVQNHINFAPYRKRSLRNFT